MLPTQSNKLATYCTDSVWMLCSQKGEIRLKIMCLKALLLSSEHLILTPGHGNKKIWQYVTKTLLVLQFIKHQKKGGNLSKVTGLYLQYRRVMDEDCLATPDPTTSMFLYWINTNRMGTAKKMTFAMFLWIYFSFFPFFFFKTAFLKTKKKCVHLS